jgi:hypothetical protein
MCIEMVSESVPGCVLQCYAYARLLQRGGGSPQALASIIVSACTTGYISASLSYSYDTDPQHRKDNPRFVGYVRDGPTERTIIVLCMCMNSALLMLLRSSATALILLTSTSIAPLYIACDLGFFFFVKTVRSDFICDFKLEGLAPSIAMSLLFRSLTKLIVDHVGLLQFLSPRHMGGLGWLLSVFWSIAVSIASLSYYFENAEVPIVEPRSAYLVAASLAALWAFVFAVFVWFMKEDYRGSFLSTMTGSEHVWRTFVEGNDATKSKVMRINKRLWFKFRESVSLWVQEGWWDWDATQPDWFTYGWKANVPEDMIPEEVDDNSLGPLSSNKGISSMRSSLGKLFQFSSSAAKKHGAFGDTAAVGRSSSGLKAGVRRSVSGVKKEAEAKLSGGIYPEAGWGGAPGGLQVMRATSPRSEKRSGGFRSPDSEKRSGGWRIPDSEKSGGWRSPGSAEKRSGGWRSPGPAEKRSAGSAEKSSAGRSSPKGSPKKLDAAREGNRTPK